MTEQWLLLVPLRLLTCTLERPGLGNALEKNGFQHLGFVTSKLILIGVAYV